MHFLHITSQFQIQSLFAVFISWAADCTKKFIEVWLHSLHYNLQFAWSSFKHIYMEESFAEESGILLLANIFAKVSAA